MKTEHNPQNPEPIARNKLTKMVTKNTNKFLTVLAYAFLEWVLILLLLMNSLFSYFITRFAAYFKLNPPCPWCSRLDLYLLKPENRTHPYKDLICEAHAKEISNLTFCSSHRKLTELSKSLCEDCLVSEPNSPENLTKCMCTCCGKSLSKKENDGENHQSGSENEYQIISDVGSFGIREAPDEDSNEDDEINVCGEIRTRDFLEAELGNGDQKGRDNKLPDITAGAIVVSEQENYAADSKEIEAELDDDDASSTIQRLKSDLESERKARNDLYSELEAERSAAAIAANQTMAMITRLQEEKATMQMEALHYQRVMEEQSEYDQQALQLLNELVAKREREKEEFEKELDVYRERVSDYEAKDKALMMVQRCRDNLSSIDDSDSDVLSINLTRGYEDEDEEGRKDISLLDCSEEWGAIEDSLGELEGERIKIMKHLRELEEKLVFGQIEEASVENPNGELLCSQEVNLGSCCFIENQPKTMASVARSLLDLSESLGNETEDNEWMGCEVGFEVSEVENGSQKRLAMEKEMDHVYGRLQALEADTEFLRHCIGSLSKGNQGVSVLKDILQHLSELRAAEICF